MTCKEFIETLAQFLSGELPAEGRGAAELHLEVCDECVSYLRSYEITIRLGKDALADEEAHSLPDDLVQVIVSRRRQPS